MTTPEETILAMSVIDTVLQQREGLMAARFERLCDLYAPMTEQPDGTMKRDPEFGIISKEDFIRFLDMPAERHSEEP